VLSCGRSATSPRHRSSGIDSLRIESVTGVDVELPLAGPGSRSYAFIIDWHIRLLAALLWVLAALLILANFSGIYGSVTSYWIMFGPATALYLLYHPVVELALGGQTPGKRIAGVRVVSRSGQPPSVAAILIRNIFRLIDSMPAFYTAGLLTTILTRDSVRIGDLAAGTVLVRLSADTRKAIERQQVLATQTRLAPARAELVSDVLERWPQLESTARRELARRILANEGSNFSDDPEVRDEQLRTALSELLVPQS
jgi:uncharacterized RDD family membrane protein YckC